MSTIANRIEKIRTDIAAMATKNNRQASAVTLVAISKNHSQESVRLAIAANQWVYGENRVQEAQEKFTHLKSEYAKLKLHLVGPLQTNKAKDAVALFDVIESLDRDSLALKLAQLREGAVKLPKLYIQVNTGCEPQKSGIAAPDADSFIDYCQNNLKLPIAGLMCVPPLGENPVPHFAMLAELAKKFNLTELSMGMSGDFDLAIALGATGVRVGTAIFGERASQ